MATIVGELPTFSYRDDALKNNVEGRLVLQVVLCGNGRVSDITIDRALPNGLTERAIEIVKLLHFTPAQFDGKPVPVMIKQEFLCAQSTCKALP